MEAIKETIAGLIQELKPAKKRPGMIEPKGFGKKDL